MFLESLLFLRYTKEYNYLSQISFKIISPWKYALLPSSVRVLETFLEAVLWKPFRLFRRILNNFSSIKCFFASLLISVVGRGENQLEPGLWCLWDAPMLWQCCLLRDLWTKLTGVMEHYLERETNTWFSIRTTKAVNVHFFIPISNSSKLYLRISVNFEATIYFF